MAFDKQRRRDGRVAAVQYLYAWSLNAPADLSEDLRYFFAEKVNRGTETEGDGQPGVAGGEEVARTREYYSFAEELVHGVLANVAEIDGRIREFAQNWEFERIAKIDLAILRLAIFEMLHRKDIPPVVSINEAIDISKEFSNADAKRFINGILDRVKASLGRPARQPQRD